MEFEEETSFRSGNLVRSSSLPPLLVPYIKKGYRKFQSTLEYILCHTREDIKRFGRFLAST